MTLTQFDGLKKGDVIYYSVEGVIYESTVEEKLIDQKKDKDIVFRTVIFNNPFLEDVESLYLIKHHKGFMKSYNNVFLSADDAKNALNEKKKIEPIENELLFCGSRSWIWSI